MPEVSPDATLIIATSWQALSRAETGDERASICNCTVVLVFAAFFIEANLNHFIEKAGNIKGLSPAPRERAGLQKKLGWVYKCFLADKPVTDEDELNLKLEDEFPGFQAIRKFRNDVSHGIVDRSVAKLDTAKQLRIAAKAIVDRLLQIARERHIQIQRGVEYEMAISFTEAGSAAT